MAGPTMVNLFATDGMTVVAQIPVPAPYPGIVVYRGLYFRLDNGRYVQATLWQHMG